MTPLYAPDISHAAYQLRYSWTGWPSSGRFQTQPNDLIENLKPTWEGDGLRVLEHRWTHDLVQILFNATPAVSPEFLAARAKGRLDHALRQSKLAIPFSRKVSVRAIGDNTRRDVEIYIERQVPKEEFLDPRFAAALAELTTVVPQVDLSQPTESARGRYWYNLHLVLVVEGRVSIRDLAVLRSIRDGCLKIAEEQGQVISRLSVMPDHLHVALRAETDKSPLEIVGEYQNSLAGCVNQGRIWSTRLSLALSESIRRKR